MKRDPKNKKQNLLVFGGKFKTWGGISPLKALKKTLLGVSSRSLCEEGDLTVLYDTYKHVCERPTAMNIKIKIN